MRLTFKFTECNNLIGHCASRFRPVLSGAVSAGLPLLSAPGGPAGRRRRPGPTVRGHGVLLPAAHHKATEEHGGDHRRPLPPEPGTTATTKRTPTQNGQLLRSHSEE